MTQYRWVKIFLSFIFICFLSNSLICQESESSDIFVFLIDQSKSMRQEALFERVLDELENFVRNEVSLGDRVIVSGFGDQVSYFHDDMISALEDKERVYSRIRDLKSEDNWTHMSAAFEHLAKRLSELQSSYPNSIKYIYIFTDGKNDPNPALKEKPEYFSEILEKNFRGKDIEAKNSFIYFITFGREAPDEVKKVAQDSKGIDVQTLPRKPEVDRITPIIPLKIILKLENDKFSLMKDDQEKIELPFKIESITRDAKVTYYLAGEQGELDLSKTMKNFTIPFAPKTSQLGEFQEEITFSLVEEPGEVSPDRFNFQYTVNEPEPVKIAVELEKKEFTVKKGKTKKVDLKFKVLSANKDAKVKFAINGKEEIIDISKSDKDFKLPISSFKDEEGSYKIQIHAEVMDQKGTLEPDRFEVSYQVKEPPLNPLLILAAIVLLCVLIWLILKLIPSFHGEILFIEQGEEYRKRLSGRTCKPFSKIKRGTGVHPGLKICPSSGGKVKVKIPKKVEITKNGLEVSKSSIFLRSEDIIEYSDTQIKYIHTSSKRRI